MKVIQKKRETEYSVYQATDGTEFNDCVECEIYENSARGVLLAEIKNCEINRGTEYDLLNTGSSDYEIRLVVPRNIQDLRNINYLYRLCLNSSQCDDKLYVTDSDINKIIMLFVSKYDNCIYFNKLDDMFNNLIGNTHKFTIEELSPAPGTINDINDLEYADEI